MKYFIKRTPRASAEICSRINVYDGITKSRACSPVHHVITIIKQRRKAIKYTNCDILNKLPGVPRILLHAWILHLNQRRLLFSYLCFQLMLNETTYEEPEEVYIILWHS